ncbi:MAG TPA: hypothetical protein P5154_03470 [Candidatus Izemoplasmatales bacterium]|nr:hypothetical protein [Candidatus Izemoplasmatales bacterium]
MKKAAWLALVLYVAVAGVLLWKARPEAAEVRILSIREERSRLITSADETIDIPLYFNQKANFYIEPRWVRNARLTNGEEEIAVSLTIVDAQETAVFRDCLFYIYRFRIGFPDMDLEGVRLNWESVRLEVGYDNDKTLSVEIGSLSMLFFRGDNPPHLDFFRLYPVMGEADDTTLLQGFVLGLDPQTASPLVITGISTGLANARIDFSAVTEWTETEHPGSGTEVIGDPEYGWVRLEPPTETGTRILNDRVSWFVPLIHMEHLRRLNRFPIFLYYEYQDQEYVFNVDDFLFFTSSPLSEVPDADICETIYRD